MKFHAAYTKSYQVFEQNASDVLNIEKKRIEVRRCTGGEYVSKLTVFVYAENDTDQIYYHPDNGAIIYNGLSIILSEFKNELASKKIN